MTRSNTTKQTINVPKKQLIRLMDIVEYQREKIKHYVTTYGDVELFYGKWEKSSKLKEAKENYEKKNNIQSGNKKI